MSRCFSQEKAVQALLTDTGFQPSALDFMLGRNADPEKKKERVFSFRNCECNLSIFFFFLARVYLLHQLCPFTSSA